MLTIWNKLPAPLQGAIVIGGSAATASVVILALASAVGAKATVALVAAGCAIFGAWIATVMDD